MHGFVYVLSNPSMPGLLKIGRTERDPTDRISELSAGSAVPTPFKLEYSLFSIEMEEVEQAIHADLTKYRVSPEREFFQASLEEVKTRLYNIVLDLLVAKLMRYNDYDLCRIVDHLVMKRPAIRSLLRQQ